VTAEPSAVSGRISLALVLHNHQPVGNFGWVFEDVYRQAYQPMVAALERHPRIRVGLHYSGPLLEWLRAERPELIERLRALVARDQAEILGGGLYEPVLASLPDRDRLGQLERMAATVESTFGRRPAGAWLAERVWEPGLPGPLAEAGYGYTILDDAHFRAAAIAEDAMWGPYTTDDQGHRITVFGTERGLRYLIPFRPVPEVIEHLREHATEAGERVGMMGDDGEKFGAWPSTWEHCWGKGHWVEDFFGAIEANAGWLATVRPRDWLETHDPIGRAYIPTSSYAEMGEWALPPAESFEFTEVLHRDREEERPEVRWLRGGFWRNFQVRYREINDLHKQMLRVSEKVEQMAPGAPREGAVDHLYRGQSNDCYWHGLFGGIYIAHMRAATFAELIAAEDLADAALGALDAAERADLDLDGRDEVRLASAGQVVTLKLAEGGGIGAWDIRPARHAVTAVLRRRPEAYHDALRRHDADGTATADVSPDAPASIHERVQVREAGLADRLVYDDYERRSGLIRILAADATPDAWAAGGRGDLGDLVDGPFGVERLGPGAVDLSRKGAAIVDGHRIGLLARTEIRLSGGRFDPVLEQRVTIRNDGAEMLVARVGIEWATTMLGGGGNPQAWWAWDGADHGRDRHDGSGVHAEVGRVAQGNDWLGLDITTTVEPQADAWHAPIETVSNSEAGFERVYQGSALLLSWPISLAPGSSWTARIVNAARVRQG
jgi:hypothetical protein